MALTSGKGGAAFAHFSFIAFLELENKIMRLGRTTRLLDCLRFGAASPEGDIFFQRFAEQEDILLDD